MDNYNSHRLVREKGGAWCAAAHCTWRPDGSGTPIPEQFRWHLYGLTPKRRDLDRASGDAGSSSKSPPTTVRPAPDGS